MSDSLLGINNFILFVSFAATVSLGCFVLFVDRKSGVNRTFAAFTCFVAIWILCDYLTNRSESAEQALFWNKMAFIGAALIPSTFLYYTLAFLGRLGNFTFLRRFFLFAPGLMFLLFSPLNLIVHDVELMEWGVKLLYGPLYSLFMIYFISYTIYALYNLSTEYRSARGIKKARIGYLFLGAAISGLAWIMITSILPSIYGISEFHRLGLVSVVIMTAFIAYSIVRHRLMSIEFVIQSALMYTALTVLIIAAYSFSLVISERYLGAMGIYGSLFVIGMASIAVTALYQPVLATLRDLADRLFFRARYDYQNTLGEMSRALASVMRIRQLAKYIIDRLGDILKVSEASFLVLDGGQKIFRSVPVEQGGRFPQYKAMKIDAASMIITHLQAERSVLVADELGSEIEKTGPAGELGKLKAEIERLGMTVWVPVILNDKLMAMFALGDKLSADMYTEEDLHLLSTLSNQVATALENARLYEEILSMKNYSENILQSMKSGVVSTDLSGRVVTFNKAFEGVTGLGREQIEGRDIKDIFEKSPSVKILIAGSFAGAEKENVESHVARPQGDLMPVSFNSVILKDSAGEKSGLLFTFSDLSEMKTLEGKVRQSDKLAAVGTMAAGMAHEIKNPLSSIKVFAQLLPQRYKDEEYRKKFAEIIPKEIARVDRIVESLLSFTRASQPKFRKCNITAVIEELLDVYDEQIKDSNIKVKRDFGEVPEIMADYTQILQAFSNLIVNSIQTMASGGDLEISVQKGPGKDRKGSNIVVRISDTGHGISRDNLKRLFDPFFTTKHGGTGLGLTIAHSIIDGHKGTIEVASEVGKGTAFTVTLPVEQ